MESSTPLISVVVPNYNNERYLSACLDSVLGQDYTNFEVVVVDDFSADASCAILRRYMERDCRLKVIFKNKNEGVVKARDDGIRSSLGEYISTLDSDDIYLCSNKLSSEFRVLHQSKEQSDRGVVAFSQIELLRENGESIGVPATNVSQGDILVGLLSRNIMIPRDFLFKKASYFEAGGFNSKIPLYEDWDLKIRLAKNCDFYYSGIVGIGYRQHASGLSRTHFGRHFRWLMYVFLGNFSVINAAAYSRAFVPFVFHCFKLGCKGLLKFVRKA